MPYRFPVWSMVIILRPNGKLASLILPLASLLAGGCSGYSVGPQVQAEARVVATSADLIGGPMAQGRPGDILLRNKHLRVIIQQTSPQIGAFGATGGNIIDADIARRPNEQGYDRVGEIALWYNLGRGASATSTQIVDNGKLTGRAIVETYARDIRLGAIDLLELGRRIMPDSPETIWASIDPEQAVELDIRTRYVLNSEDRAVLIESIFINRTDAVVNLPIGDLLSIHGSAAPFFSAGQGVLFGGPSQGYGLSEQPREVGYNQTEFVGWAAPEVTYLYYPALNGIDAFAGKTACVQLKPAYACLAGARIDARSGVLAEAKAWSDESSGFFELPPEGDGVAYFRRYFAIGGQDLAEPAAAIASVLGNSLSTVRVTVHNGNGEPVAEADVAVLKNAGSDTWLPWTHAKSRSDGIAALSLAAGRYRLLVQKSGYANATDSGLPESFDITIDEDQLGDRDEKVELVAGGTVDFFVRDDRGDGIAARVMILGTDPSPEKLDSTSDAGLSIYPFRDLTSDPYPTAGDFGLSISTTTGNAVVASDVIAVVDTDADGLGRLELEAGAYVALATRGLAFAAVAQEFTVVGDDIERVLIDLPRALDTFGWAQVDFAIESDYSPMGKRTIEAQLKSAAAEGLDVAIRTDRNTIGQVHAGEADVVVANGATLDLPGIGMIAATPLQPLSIPLRAKIVTAPNEEIVPASLSGGLPGWLRAAGDLTGPAELLTTLATRGDVGDAPIFALRSPATYFDNIGLQFDFTLGYDAEDPAASAPNAVATNQSLRLGAADLAYADTWNALLIDATFSSPTDVWKTLNSAFAYWNLGRRTPLIAGSGSSTRLSPGVGALRTLVRHPEGDDRRFDASTDEAMALVQAAVHQGFAVISNGPVLNLSVSGVLFDTQPTTPTVLDVFPAVGIGELLTISRTNFPSSGTAFELHLTATISLQSPTWAMPRQLDLFINAPAQNISAITNDSSGDFLAAATSASWQLTDSELAAAVTDAEYRFENTDATIRTTSTLAERYELEWTYSWVIEGARLVTTNLTDIWVSARATGDSSLRPIVNGSLNSDVSALAIANPVFVDLSGDVGVDFSTAFQGPCESANSPDCPQ